MYGNKNTISKVIKEFQTLIVKDSQGNEKIVEVEGDCEESEFQTLIVKDSQGNTGRRSFSQQTQLLFQTLIVKDSQGNSLYLGLWKNITKF